jgi:hypothetical protein
LTESLAALDVQAPFEMVQVYTYVPGRVTVTVVPPAVSLTNVLAPGPEVCDHRPDPMVGVSPPSDALVSDAQMSCVGPTLAVVGIAEKNTESLAAVGVQLPLEMVQV